MIGPRRARLAALVVGGSLLAAACGGDDASAPAGAVDPTTAVAADDSGTTAGAPTTASTTTTTTTTVPTHPPAPNGRTYPSTPDSPAAAGARLYEVEQRIHELDPGAPEFGDLAHEQQMLYRSIGRNPEWIPEIVADAPADIAPFVTTHLAARRAIAGISHGGDPPANVPAWEIIEPLPTEELRAIYEQAEADTGIDWAILAAINLIETGFGRIDGISTAGAQGPMQFLPTTWEEVSDGDIRDPYDAIPAAAAYLVRRGGPDDMHQAIWGYNNSDSYVAAVTHYANLFHEDDRSFLATHAWEIHYAAGFGDLWLPVGYRREAAQPVEEYVAEAPWSAPPSSG